MSVAYPILTETLLELQSCSLCLYYDSHNQCSPKSNLRIISLKPNTYLTSKFRSSPVFLFPRIFCFSQKFLPKKETHRETGRGEHQPFLNQVGDLKCLTGCQYKPLGLQNSQRSKSALPIWTLFMGNETANSEVSESIFIYSRGYCFEANA